jgi:hypothetical protein
VFVGENSNVHVVHPAKKGTTYLVAMSPSLRHTHLSSNHRLRA